MLRLSFDCRHHDRAHHDDVRVVDERVAPEAVVPEEHRHLPHLLLLLRLHESHGVRCRQLQGQQVRPLHATTTNMAS